MYLRNLSIDQLTKAHEAADEQDDPYEGKNPAAVELGRQGGLKGGRARAEKLTPEQRSEIARKAARARWKPQITKIRTRKAQRPARST
jgi:hypothetical protein